MDLLCKLLRTAAVVRVAMTLQGRRRRKPRLRRARRWRAPQTTLAPLRPAWPSRGAGTARRIWRHRCRRCRTSGARRRRWLGGSRAHSACGRSVHTHRLGVAPRRAATARRFDPSAACADAGAAAAVVLENAMFCCFCRSSARRQRTLLLLLLLHEHCAAQEQSYLQSHLTALFQLNLGVVDPIPVIHGQCVAVWLLLRPPVMHAW
jgi:hypothetical protein